MISMRAALAALLAALVLVLVLFWTALLAVENGMAKGLLSSALTAKLHRPVSFRSYRAKLLTSDPWIVLTDLTVQSPPEISRDDLLEARTVTLHLRASALWLGRVEMTSMAIDDALLRLVRLGPDRNNYTFGHGGSGKFLGGVQSLSVTNSRWRMDDPERHVVLAGSASNDGRAGEPLPLAMQAQGTISEQPVSVEMRGGGLNGRKPNAPWPVDVVLHDGRAVLHLSGEAQAPFDFRGFDLKVDSTGPNLSVLGWLLRTEAPNSPPYRLTVRARRADHTVRLTELKATLGSSNVTGDITSDHSQARRRIDADLVFGVLHAADLGVLASPPAPHAEARSEPGAKPRTGEILGESKPLPLAGLRKLDTSVRLRADRVEGFALPIRDLSLKLRLVDGRLDADPISLLLPAGSVTGAIAIDAAKAVPIGEARLSIRKATVGTLRPQLRSVVDGEFDTDVRLSGTGASPKEMLANASGRAAFLAHGGVRRSMAAMLGGDSLGAVSAGIGGGAGMAPVDCAVGEFRTVRGVVASDRLMIVTPQGYSDGMARVNLANGGLEVRLQGHPARRFAPTPPPILITGTIAHPQTTVNKGSVIGGAVASVLTAPAAALAPQRDDPAQRCLGAGREIARYLAAP